MGHKLVCRCGNNFRVSSSATPCCLCLLPCLGSTCQACHLLPPIATLPHRKGGVGARNAFAAAVAAATNTSARKLQKFQPGAGETCARSKLPAPPKLDRPARQAEAQHGEAGKLANWIWSQLGHSHTQMGLSIKNSLMINVLPPPPCCSRLLLHMQMRDGRGAGIGREAGR